MIHDSSVGPAHTGAADADLDGEQRREAARAATLAAIEAASRAVAGQAELRVLAGPQAGAKLVWSDGEALLVATEAMRARDDQPANDRDAGATDTGAEGTGRATEPEAPVDVLLFDDVSPSVRLRILLSNQQAYLEVLRGEVRLGPRTLAAGARACWPMYTPLRLGRAVIAFGQRMPGSWPDIDGLPDEPAQEGAPEGVDTRANGAEAAVRSGTARAPATAGAADTGRGIRRAAVWLGLAGGLVMTLCAAALWTLAPGPQAEVAPAPAPSVRSLLDAGPFAALESARRADGRLLLRGRLATRAERKALDAWLAAQGLSADTEIVVDEVLARNVGEVFRVNGVDVEATSAGAGRIRARAAEPDRAKVARAAEAVRRDVPGLAELTVENTAPQKAVPPPPPVPADPGKRIVSVVPGSPGYLITADGARYFVGAMLPSGYRVTRVGRASVTLEHAGREVRIDL